MPASQSPKSAWIADTETPTPTYTEIPHDSPRSRYSPSNGFGASQTAAMSVAASINGPVVTTIMFASQDDTSTVHIFFLHMVIFLATWALFSSIVQLFSSTKENKTSILKSTIRRPVHGTYRGRRKRNNVLCLKVVISFLLLVRPTAAALTKNAGAASGCIQANRNGRPCFYPQPAYAWAARCHNKRFETILHHHINSPHRGAASAAYYNFTDSSFLGNGSWSLGAQQIRRPTSDIVLCQTGGIHRSSKFFTTCRFSSSDNDHEVGIAAGGRCEAVHRHGKAVIDEDCSMEPDSDLLESALVVLFVAVISTWVLRRIIGRMWHRMWHRR
ncbi:hypothetical protein BKA62DRAFT_701233 [Auriculariales sp. MPI-PUGE-AT-0066]|nr:hypothetical protein BKA62DRAFT_701233 [Auriculariales sp. MPI-PUGE-AT-0066]